METMEEGLARLTAETAAKSAKSNCQVELPKSAKSNDACQVELPSRTAKSKAGAAGGRVRAGVLSPERRREIAQRARASHSAEAERLALRIADWAMLPEVERTATAVEIAHVQAQRRMLDVNGHTLDDYRSAELAAGTRGRREM